MKIRRRRTKRIYLGELAIGGGAPVVVQSMTKTDTRDVQATVRQIRKLEKSGCEAVRLAVPDAEAAEALKKIGKSVKIPLIADIHFDWRLALKAVDAGVQGLRLNPGNIGARWKIKEVVDAIQGRRVPIRIGVNSGSLERDILEKYGHPTPEAMVASASRHIAILEDMGFTDIKVSLKGSDVTSTVDAYRAFSRSYKYPLHIGITEAGPPPVGIVKSAVGLGILLSQGIGDTIRVSLTASPEEEVRVAYEILRSLGIRKRGANLVSCPTCGRCSINVINLATKVEKRLRDVETPVTVAVMGCVVNGPGEAREADFGIAGGRGEGIIFKKGRVVKKAEGDRLLDELMRLIEEHTGKE
ncbi:MAG: flavodoxin-dependent (E)-4-hydroxy-3-methylbut-2-enyl-diphosphate synthase [Nitrospirae bacterium]|nr:MAG: flavodoxin-dependent (E)-4-hydroxy-3-methylbut-2-enyl-diphosphate synthase [Nitrospirota bacterium]